MTPHASASRASFGCWQGARVIESIPGACMEGACIERAYIERASRVRTEREHALREHRGCIEGA